MIDWSGHFLDERVPLDPLLVEPIDLFGEQARRRHIVDALASQLGPGIVERLHYEINAPGPYSCLWRSVDPLIDALSAQRAR